MQEEIKQTRKRKKNVTFPLLQNCSSKESVWREGKEWEV